MPELTDEQLIAQLKAKELAPGGVVVPENQLKYYHSFAEDRALGRMLEAQAETLEGNDQALGALATLATAQGSKVLALEQATVFAANQVADGSPAGNLLTQLQFLATLGGAPPQLSGFKPALTPTTLGLKHQQQRFSFLTQIGIQTWAERDYHTQVDTGNPPVPPETFALLDAKPGIRAQVAAAKLRRAKFLVQPGHNEEGFMSFPCTQPTNLPQLTHTTKKGASFTGPAYEFYCVVPGVADQNLHGFFVEECLANGIEPVLYWGLSGSLNLSGGECFDQGFSSEREFLIADYWARALKQCIQLYGYRYVWTDLAGMGVTNEFVQRWYDAVHSAGALMLANHFGLEVQGEFPFPVDIQYQEEYRPIVLGSTSYEHTARTVDGITYQLPQGVVATPYDNFRWYNVGPTGVYVFQDPAIYQQLINQVLGAPGAHFMAGMMLDKYGFPDQASLDYYDDLDFGPDYGIVKTGPQAETTAYLSRLSAAGYSAPEPVATGFDERLAVLKTQPVYAKIKEMWLYFGASAATHALGFKNVADITWTGNIVHSATGAKSDGTTGYGNLNLNPSTVGGLTAENVGISFYSRTETGPADEREMGGEDTASLAVLRFIVKLNNQTSYFEAGAKGTGILENVPVPTTGLFVTTSTNTTEYTPYRNGASLGPAQKAGDAPRSVLYNGPLLILAQGDQNGVPQGFSTKECCFAAVTAGLTAADVVDLNAFVEPVQDLFNRGVQS